MTGLHPWVRPITLAFYPAYMDRLLESALQELLDWLRANGNRVQERPDSDTDLVITTARFNHPVPRKEALLFHSKRIFRLRHRPQILTLVSLPQSEYEAQIAHFSELARQPVQDSTNHQYAGLGPRAAEVLLEQARRGGPEVALGRLIQGQVKSIRAIALVSDEDENPLQAIHFDLAGAHPTTDATDPAYFAEDTGRRIITAVCAHEVKDHDLLPDPLPEATWNALTTPEAMIRAGHDFTRFAFFTTPFSIEKLLGYRNGIGEAIAAQYSEGCYAVFEPEIPGLITTATGSSRLVDKRAISRDDQAIVIGVKPDGRGALVKNVEGRPTVLPSVEAVEMMGICEAVPAHPRRNGAGEVVQAPPVRAILHGHLGVEAYDPDAVEAVSLDEPYYDYLVSCGTGALASATARAFARSTALCDLKDPRKVVFLEQPGHGVVIVEKWVEDRGPFETIRKYLEAGQLCMTMAVPQGRIQWQTTSGPDGKAVTRKVEP